MTLRIVMKMADSEEIEKHPWPKTGDTLFKADDDWQNNACILNYLNDDVRWSIYVNGYKCAADILVEHAKNNRLSQNSLVYPIVFLYRQHIELCLKRLIMNGNQLFDSSEKPPLHHEIDKLWKQCRIILEKVWPDEPTEDLDAVEKCIVQFSKKDPFSTSFRYPVDKCGNPSLPGVKHINLRNLSEIIARLSALLDGCNSAISDFLDAKSETLSEY